MKKLPDNFFFGAALSGPQTEGAHNIDGKLPSLWDTWSDLRINDFYNQVGSYVGNDFYNRYEEDIKIFRDLGLQSIRTSIQWSRFLDLNGNINPKGAEFYHKLLACGKKYGVEIFICLYHFDLPTHLFNRGGWESRAVVEEYARYAHKAFVEFPEVKRWFTFNEPIVEPEQRYRTGQMWPFIKDFKRSIAAQYHIALAHSLAVGEFRSLQAAGKVAPDVKIGMICNFSPSYTKPNPSDADKEALRITDGLANRWWLDLVGDGKLPEDIIEDCKKMNAAAPIRPGDKEILRQGKVDWIGFNYYAPTRIQAPAKKVDENGNAVFAEPYIWPERKMNTSRGWEIYPKGVYDFGMLMKERYPNLYWFVSENGMGVMGEDKFKDENGVIQDDYRVDFVREHLEWIAKGIEDGMNCLGYHYWGVIDNWSWANAFKNRYGFVEVRLQDAYRRCLKKSASWLKEVVKTHEVK